MNKPKINPQELYGNILDKMVLLREIQEFAESFVPEGYGHRSCNYNLLQLNDWDSQDLDCLFDLLEDIELQADRTHFAVTEFMHLTDSHRIQRKRDEDSENMEEDFYIRHGHHSDDADYRYEMSKHDPENVL
jgi:hypothetical protein